MNKYHIGTRLRGFAKKYLKKKNAELETKEDFHHVPHITFIRPFYTPNELLLVKNFEETCRIQPEAMTFKIENFDLFDLIKIEEKVFYAKVIPDKSLDFFIGSLEEKLKNVIKYEEERLSEKRNLHATVYIGEKNRMNPKIMSGGSSIGQYLLRAYLLKNKKILFEYDFFLESLLNREDALNKKLFKETIESFKNKTGLKPSKKGFLKINDLQFSSGTRAKKL